MLTAAHFASHAKLYQEVSAQAVTLRELLATTLGVGAGSTACQQCHHRAGPQLRGDYEQANAHGQKVQAAGSNMAGTDSTVGSIGLGRHENLAVPLGVG
jgi:hypothetical protein